MDDPTKKYEELFKDHMKIAEEKFIEKNKRPPSFYEKLEAHEKLMDYFYDDSSASFLILLAFVVLYLDFNFFI